MVIPLAAMHYYTHLAKDKKLKKLMDEHGPIELVKEKNICLYLCYSIMSQQLSTKVAEVFHQRFLDLYGGKEPTAKQIANTKFATLRAIGLSNAKANYVLNVANYELRNGMSIQKFEKMGDEDIISYLTQIKGVGRWTVEMILMFALAREDHFAAGDLGLQTAMIKLYKLDSSIKKPFHEDMLRISKRWSPYRTYASMYLWRYKDKK